MPLDPHPAYPFAGAFVLKLHQDCRPGRGTWRGRLEHIASGAQWDFRSTDELIAGLARMTPPLETLRTMGSAHVLSPFSTTDGDSHE